MNVNASGGWLNHPTCQGGEPPLDPSVGDVDAFGELMFASHESSRHNFENSTPNLDALVEIAKSTNGVIGSRLTGGGFGGSTVSLIRSEVAQKIIDSMQKKYLRATGAQCSAILTRPSQGARILRRD